MPELPDIEVFKQYFDSTALNKPIQAIEIREDILLEETTRDDLETALIGQQFTETARHGKYMFSHTNGDQWIMWHFGMTGQFQYYEDPADEPEYTYALITFENGYHLAFRVPRKLGRIQLIEALDAFLEEKGLGPDALDCDFETFSDLMSGRRGMVKTTLMNQSIIAGIGNELSDEILFRMQVHPKTKMTALDEEGIAQLYRTVQGVLREATTHIHNDGADYPDSWLLGSRDEGAPCPRGDGTITRIKVSGRGTYFCPECQPQP